MNIGDRIIELLRTKGTLNRDVEDTTFLVFNRLKQVLQEFEKSLKQQMGNVDPRIRIQYTDKGTYEVELTVADDLLIFIMHTNAFVFDPAHAIWRSGYVNSDNSRATVEVVSIYNFLSDSFKFDRKNDMGQLIGRMFVNKEEHFFMEGKKQLGFLFNDYVNMQANEEKIQAIIEAAVTYSMDIDVIVPPFDLMKEITVFETMAYTLQTSLKSSQRLGFKFQNDKPNIEG
ncbi:hypothetical protein BH11BAC2_BH11BAC2_09740 [soil metagenome]